MLNGELVNDQSCPCHVYLEICVDMDVTRRLKNVHGDLYKWYVLIISLF